MPQSLATSLSMLSNRDLNWKQNLHGLEHQHSTQLHILNLRFQIEVEKKCRPTVVVHRENANENCKEENTRQCINDQNLQMKTIEKKTQGNAEMTKTCLGEHRSTAKPYAHRK